MWTDWDKIEHDQVRSLIPNLSDPGTKLWS